MSALKDNTVYLSHIRDAIGKILKYTDGGKEEFLNDPRTQDATVRNLEVIGEAVKNLSPDFKQAFPQISSKRITGMSDKMIHEYFGVNLELLWQVVQREIPNLNRAIEQIIREKT